MEEHATPEQFDAGTDREGSVLDELLRNQVRLREAGERLGATEERVETGTLVDLVRHGPVLEALLSGPMDRREIEGRLDVSRATSHRLTRWLDDQGYVQKTDGRLHLTGHGQTVAEEVLRFERNVAAAARLAPLFECICPDHQEFVLEPFADATVTEATPDDPYGPARRFLELLGDSATLRGFNATQMVPLAFDGYREELFADTDAEIISLPSVVETLFEAHPEQVRAAVDAGHLALRTREAVPYGLAVFDDRVGVGGYDEETGSLRVFVDADATIAREWGERAYAAYRERSEPITDVDDLAGAT